MTKKNFPIQIDHIAIAVEDMDSALAFWRDALGLPLSEMREVPAENAKIAFLPAGEGQIELVLPTTDDSGLAKYLAKRGPGMHHLCLAVPDIDSTLERLRQKGIRLINETPRVGADGKRYAFIHPESTGGVLVELYEE
jgi:methylmalonyl-CoA/ethylmalonyl-CoA epimerase